MWKRCLAAIMCIASLSSLAACGQSKPQPAPKQPSITISQDERDQLTQIATDFEIQTRTWGVNPAILDNTDQFTHTDAVSALNLVRTPEAMQAPDVISNMKRDKTVGPDAPSPYCTAEPKDEIGCQSWPTMLSYWRQQHWTMGAAVIPDSIKVTVKQPTIVTVTGTVRVVLWSDTTGAYNALGRWAFTPVTGDIVFRDKLTIINQHVSQRQALTSTSWLADPWLSAWDVNPAEESSSWLKRSVHAMGLASVGEEGNLPNLGLSHDMNVDILANEQIYQAPGFEQSRSFDKLQFNVL